MYIMQRQLSGDTLFTRPPTTTVPTLPTTTVPTLPTTTVPTIMPIIAKPPTSGYITNDGYTATQPVAPMVIKPPTIPTQFSCSSPCLTGRGGLPCPSCKANTAEASAKLVRLHKLIMSGLKSLSKSPSAELTSDAQGGRFGLASVDAIRQIVTTAVSRMKAPHHDLVELASFLGKPANITLDAMNKLVSSTDIEPIIEGCVKELVFSTISPRLVPSTPPMVFTPPMAPPTEAIPAIIDVTTRDIKRDESTYVTDGNTTTAETPTTSETPPPPADEEILTLPETPPTLLPETPPTLLVETTTPSNKKLWFGIIGGVLVAGTAGLIFFKSRKR